MMIEKLEGRRLLSTANLGGDGALVVHLESTGGSVVITETAKDAGGNVVDAVNLHDNNANTDQQFAGVKRIIVLGRGGSDFVEVITQNVPVMVSGGGGNDQVAVSANAVENDGVTVNPAYTGSGSLIVGGSGSDFIFAGGLSNSTIIGGSGNETIEVGAAAHKVPNSGTPVFTGGSQMRIIAGSGTDTITAICLSNSTIRGGSGFDTIIVTADSGGMDALGNEVFFGGQNMTILGGSGNDSITAAYLSNSLIDGGSGDDIITNVAGTNDTLLGGSGDDTIFDMNSVADVINGGSGSNTITT